MVMCLTMYEEISMYSIVEQRIPISEFKLDSEALAELRADLEN